MSTPTKPLRKTPTLTIIAFAFWSSWLLKLEIRLGRFIREHCVELDASEGGEYRLGTFSDEVCTGGARGGGDDAVHFRADGGAKADQGILHNDALGRGQTNLFARQVINERIGLLARDIITCHDDIHLAQTLDANDGVDNLFKSRLGRRAANADGDGRIRDGFIHQFQNPRSRLSNFLNDFLIKDRLLILQSVDKRVTLRIRRRRRRKQ
mmetsp:Transcript_3186/g.6847  ORF Transcript_3186/g.6847 Transcript_3186/m.6847 type:complete len:209 (-) Transcript_3186:512-1138(-)